jgi:hypothetical protein
MQRVRCSFLSITSLRGTDCRHDAIGSTSNTAVAYVAITLVSSGVAEAKGCIKGAIVGGVAGHMAGHGKLGAAAGCVTGHHEANKPDPNKANAQAPSGQK